MMTLGPEGVEHQFQVTEQILVLLQKLSLNFVLIFIISFFFFVINLLKVQM